MKNMFRFVYVASLLFHFSFSPHAMAYSIPAAQTQKSYFWKPPEFHVQKAMGYNIYTFATPEPLKNEVDFWIRIYTNYTTRQGVFHIAGQIDQILGEIDLSDVYLNPKWGPIRRELEAGIIVERQRKFIAKKFGIKSLKTIRLQMGLKDRMQTAIFESGRYFPMMEEIFKKNNIPTELTRLVFVESSFNIEAQSKVGASGLWQIMPNVGKKYKYLQKTYDKRNHPLYATQVAADILKQNYKILGSWPLAVTSYNFGVGRMLKVRKKMKSDDAAEIFSSPKLTKHIGFASRNFYATFLAALQVESHANLYYGEPLMIAGPQDVEHIHLTKNTRVKALIDQYDLPLLDFKRLNIHVQAKYLKIGQIIPKGTLITIPRNQRLAEKEDPPLPQ